MLLMSNWCTHLFLFTYILYARMTEYTSMETHPYFLLDGGQPKSCGRALARYTRLEFKRRAQLLQVNMCKHISDFDLLRAP